MLKNIGVFGAVAAVSLAACSTRTIEREVIHTPAQPATVQVAPAPAPCAWPRYSRRLRSKPFHRPQPPT